jgi:hypothetical protein
MRKIPEKFMISGRTFSVQFSDELLTHTGNVGRVTYSSGVLTLQSPLTSRAEDETEQTFLHETVHTVLNQIGESELNDNEDFVDRLASALHQVLVTSGIWKDAE